MTKGPLDAGGTRARGTLGMEVSALQRCCAKAAILATACAAIILWCISCGGGGSTSLVSVSTPGFSLSSTAIPFGNVSVGAASTPQTATLTNDGNATLALSSILVQGADASDFTLTNNCGSSLAASAQCTLSAVFTPTALGTRTASVVFTDNATGSPQSLSLTGTGTAPAVSLSATSLSFGNQMVSTTSAAQAVTLTNSGTAALSITSVTITGTNASDFAQTNTCGSSVAAGANCTISVTFTPAATGSRAASLSITDNAAGSPQTVGLSGTGTTPVVSLSPTSIPFGNQAVGTTSTAQTVTVTNNGTATLSITSVAITGANASAFGQTNNCGSSLAVGANCTISVTFSPMASGSDTASVSISDSAAGSPQTVGLSGTGTAPIASVSPTSLAFGTEPISLTSSPQSVTLSNTGNATLTITSVTITGTNANDFAENTTCGSSLAAGANCTIAVTFTPSIAGSETATLSISDNASGSPQTVSLSGTGVHAVVLSWDPSPTSGVVGYYIYRGTTSGGEGTTPLNTSPVAGGCTSTTTCTYTDETVQADQTYWYEVTAVASDDVTQSEDSNQASANVP